MSDPSPSLRCDVTERDNAVVLSLAGRSNPTEAEKLDEAIDDAVRRASELIIVDLSGLEHIGSFGIGAMIRLEKDAASRHAAVRIAAPSDHVMDLFVKSRLDQKLPIFPTVEAALVRPAGKR